MANTSSRTLRLLSLLQTHRYWPGTELADRLQISPRTLRRDVDRLRLSYTVQSGEQTARHVEPHRLVSLGRRWYLVAYDLLRQDWRSFRLDRLEQPRNTGARFSPRTLPAKDAAAFVRAGIGNLASSTHSVEVLIHATAVTVRASVGQWATIEDIDAARCLLRMTVDNLNWAALAVGSVGAEFKVLQPPELTVQLREWARP